ncbi:hypothetical protein [Hymenobacter persicinus]|uniref:Uncharacterized protein n=1 Tax=Hymenobacter persicinus TaxID=2025506 RepID=A0A4Q5LCS3_9BACT|nr:hypothetical protein [Hymenobacter persicinus]RYU81010.1 hypothetical protein EWM57_07145 [Hymenobacter persicinus]
MAVSEDILRENYRRLSDDKLLRIVSEDAVRLRPEALALLQDELRTRGLAEVAEQSVQAQFRVLDEAGVQEYCALLQAQPCPLCQSAARPLNATITSKVLSFLVMTTQKKAFAIACPGCLDTLSREANTSSALLGWWGVPWGLIRTPQALIFNNKMAKGHHLPYANDLLKAFVVSNVGRIEAAKGNPADLQNIIRAPRLG